MRIFFTVTAIAAIFTFYSAFIFCLGIHVCKRYFMSKEHQKHECSCGDWFITEEALDAHCIAKWNQHCKLPHHKLLSVEEIKERTLERMAINDLDWRANTRDAN